MCQQMVPAFNELAQTLAKEHPDLLAVKGGAVLGLLTTVFVWRYVCGRKSDGSGWFEGCCEQNALFFWARRFALLPHCSKRDFVFASILCPPRPGVRVVKKKANVKKLSFCINFDLFS